MAVAQSALPPRTIAELTAAMKDSFSLFCDVNFHTYDLSKPKDRKAYAAKIRRIMRRINAK